MKRVYIIDDHPVMRQSCTLLLQRIPGVELCGEAASAEEALPLLEAARPDVVLVDMSLPGMSGIELLSVLQERMPTISVLIISGHEDQDVEEGVLAQGAGGYLPKDYIATELNNAIQTVLAGKVYQFHT